MIKKSREAGHNKDFVRPADYFLSPDARFRANDGSFI